MRKISKVVFVLGAVFLLNGCDIKFPKAEDDEVEKFEFKMPIIELSDILTANPACDKSDTEQSIPEDVAQDKIVLKDIIETQDFEEVNCQGQVTKSGRGPVRNFEESLKIDPPMKFEKTIDQIEVSNARTCDTMNFETYVDEFHSHPFSQGIATGEIQLAVGLSDYLGLNLLTPLAMREKNNLLKISYFHCARKQENPETKATECAERVLMGAKEVLVDIQIERPELAGKRTVKETCPVAR